MGREEEEGGGGGDEGGVGVGARGKLQVGCASQDILSIVSTDMAYLFLVAVC